MLTTVTPLIALQNVQVWKCMPHKLCVLQDFYYKSQTPTTLEQLEELLLSSTDVNGVGNTRKVKTHTAEPLAPQPSRFEDVMAIGKLKTYKLPYTV